MVQSTKKRYCRTWELAIEVVFARFNFKLFFQHRIPYPAQRFRCDP